MRKLSSPQEPHNTRGELLSMQYDGTTQNVGTPLEDIDNEGSSEVGAFYSILPIRDTAVKERWKYRLRRWVFYIMFAALMTLVLRFTFMINDLGSWFWVIHLLWFDLDVTVTKNQNFVRFFHGVSFIGAFITAAIGSLIIAFEPSFIQDRSNMQHRSEVEMWTVHSITNYIPPVFHIIDLFYNYEALRKRHYIMLPGTIPKHSHHSTFRQFMRVMWMFVSPVIVVVVWFILHFYPEYDAIANYFSVTVPALVVLDLLSGVLLLVILVIRPKTKYPPLLNG